MLGFTQTLTNVRGTRTVSTTNSNVNYAVDAAGNLTSDGLRTFEYDPANRLSKARIFKDGEEASIRYLHNAVGQRVFKGEPTASQTLPSEEDLGTSFIDWLKKNFKWLYATAQANTSIGTAYVYGDGEIPTWALLGEYDNGSAKGAGRSEFIWLPTDDPSTGSGQASAIPIGMIRNGKLFAIHADHLGTPRLMTNEQNQPVWQWPYSAFGNNKPTGVLKAAPNPKVAITNVPVLLKATGATEMGLRFPGQVDDPETGTFQNNRRSYWAMHGGFTQFDPTGLNGGLDRRGYAGGNALTYTDPMGLQHDAQPPRRPNRPGWWNDVTHPITDTRSCATGECAAGALPVKPPQKMSPGACFAACFAAKTGVGLTGGALTAKVAMSIGPRLGAAVSNLMNSEVAILGSELLAVEFCYKQCDFKGQEVCEADQLSNITAP